MTPGQERMARLFRQQSDGCGTLGSPLYAALLSSAADDIEAGGVTAAVLAGHEQDPGPSALALRLAGTVHRLVLEGRAPALAAYYPSVGGAPGDPAAMWAAFRGVLECYPAEVRAGLASPPQTNEVGRAAALVGGLLRVAAATDLPIRLIEMGASAGLNLRADHFRYDLADGVAVGPSTSPVHLVRPWSPEGSWPPVDARLEVVDRAGCDPSPVDPTTGGGRRRLESYTWPDQVERLARLRGACEVAAVVPARLDRAAAADWLPGELDPLPTGVATVLWHSVMWQYVGGEERQRIEDTLAVAATRATRRAPLARVAMEPARRPSDGHFGFLVTLTVWPGGRRRLLGEAKGHGPPVVWAR